MKNRMLCLALLCFSQSFAQVTNPLDSQMVELTQNLNFQEVTSGILFDRGAQTARPDGYDGSASTDTIFSFDDWWLQYAAMYTGNVAAINTLDSVGMWKPEVLALIDSGILPLMVMDVDYHRLVRDSVLFFDSFNLMNDQLYDVTGRTQTPYSAHQLVSFSPRKSNWHDDLSVDFQMNTEFIISNSTKTLSSVEVDFGKGSGFQTVALNSKIKVSYSQYGVKWLKLKLTYTDGNFYFAVSKFTLESDGSDQPKSITGNYDDVVQIEHPTLSNHGAELQIDYGCTNEGEIRKPYIYVEGFNPEEFGDFNYNRLYDNPSLTDRDDLYPSWQFYQFLDWPSGYPILDELQTNNYDIIYVDFEEGAGNIVYNAQTLMEVIKWVNEQKAANCSSYPNTLVGYSMGGVVARLALTYMEDDEDAGTGPPHDVSYYVSVDSPHLGANIPRGLTASILDAESYDFLGFDVTDGIDAIQEAYDVLFSPAARQMLYYSGEGYEPLVYGHGPTYMAFQAILQAQGMPERTIKNIAIAKGNSSGNDQGFGSQAELVDIDLNSFNATGCLVNIENNLGDDLINGAGFLAGAFLFIKLGFFAQVEMDIDAMPGYTTQEFRIYRRWARVFFLFIPLQWEKYETKAKTVYPYDGAQGGKYPYSSFGGAGFLEDAVANVYSPCIEFFHPAFNFIPTASALNITELKQSPTTSFDPNTYLNGDSQDFDKAFVLDATKYPTLADAPSNESHLDLTPSNVFPFSEFISPDYNINSTGTINDFTFNFGFGNQNNDIKESSDRITRLITVGSTSSENGTICFNCAGRVNIIDDNSHPTNEAESIAVELSRSCGSGVGRIRLENGGSVRIGENNTKTAVLLARDNSWIELNDGIIEVREGSELIIASGAELRLNGGILRVMDGGKVTIKDGGLLRFEENASIELNGNDAELALGGLTYVGDNAKFGFTYQGTESGYIRLLEEGYWGERFAAGANAEVFLKGEGKDDLILFVEESADFWAFNGAVPNQSFTSQYFHRFKIRDGKVGMEPSSRLNIVARTNISNVHFEKSGIGDSVEGLKVFERCYIYDSDFNGVPIYGAFQYLYNGLLLVDGCTFSGSPIKVRSRFYSIRYSSFIGSDVDSKFCTLSNRITNSAFHRSDVYDDSNIEHSIISSTFTDSYIEKEGGRLTLRCSDFTDESAVLVDSNCELNLSTLYDGGYNLFQNNAENIWLNGAYNILLESGYNELYYYDGIFNIWGELDFAATSCPGPLNARLNVWTPSASSTDPPGYPDLGDFQINVQFTPPGGGVGGSCPNATFDFGQVATPATCGEFDDPRTPEGPKSNSKSNEDDIVAYITTPTYYDSIPFREALIDASIAASVLDSSDGDDLIAAARYYEILKYGIPAPLGTDSLRLWPKTSNGVRWATTKLQSSDCSSIVYW